MTDKPDRKPICCVCGKQPAYEWVSDEEIFNLCSEHEYLHDASNDELIEEQEKQLRCYSKQEQQLAEKDKRIKELEGARQDYKNGYDALQKENADLRNKLADAHDKINAMLKDGFEYPTIPLSEVHDAKPLLDEIAALKSASKEKDDRRCAACPMVKLNTDLKARIAHVERYISERSDITKQQLAPLLRLLHGEPAYINYKAMVEHSKEKEG